MKRCNSRKDIISGKSFPKNELLRLILIDGQFIFDKDSSLQGRGYYIHKDLEAIQALKSQKLLKRFKARIADEEINKMKEAL